MNITEFKSHFYGEEEFIHFNNSGQGLIPDVNRDLAIHWLQRFYREGSHSSLEAREQIEVTRQKLAVFIGASEDETSFFQTAASALSQVAFGIGLKNGDEILTWDQEYPSNFYPWRVAAEKSGARLIQIESEGWQTPLQKIINRVTGKTKVVAISWVQYQTGSVTDLKTLSQTLRHSGIWLVADVIQGVGVRPFNFHDCGFDAVCCGSHKWLCSSYGAAFMAIKRARIPELAPLAVGAMTYGTPDTEKSFAILPREDARRYEPGSKAMVPLIAMGTTLDLFASVGIGAIFGEACRLGDRLRSGLSTLGFKVVSPEGPIVAFGSSSQTTIEKVAQALKEGKVSFAQRGPGIRLSVHAYNRDAEVDRVLEILGLMSRQVPR